jgi:molecular chaperone GrpE (heat shock protein)
MDWENQVLELKKKLELKEQEFIEFQKDSKSYEEELEKETEHLEDQLGEWKTKYQRLEQEQRLVQVMPIFFFQRGASG